MDNYIVRFSDGHLRLRIPPPQYKMITTYTEKPRRKYSLNKFYLVFQVTQLKKLNFKQQKLK